MWEPTLKINIYFLRCLNVSLQVKEVLDTDHRLSDYLIPSLFRPSRKQASQATIPVIAETIADQFKNYINSLVQNFLEMEGGQWNNRKRRVTKKLNWSKKLMN